MYASGHSSRPAPKAANERSAPLTPKLSKLGSGVEPAAFRPDAHPRRLKTSGRDKANAATPASASPSTVRARFVNDDDDDALNDVVVPVERSSSVSNAPWLPPPSCITSNSSFSLGDVDGIVRVGREFPIDAARRRLRPGYPFPCESTSERTIRHASDDTPARALDCRLGVTSRPDQTSRSDGWKSIVLLKFVILVVFTTDTTATRSLLKDERELASGVDAGRRPSDRPSVASFPRSLVPSFGAHHRQSARRTSASAADAVRTDE